MNSSDIVYKKNKISCREEPPEGAVLYLEPENKVLILNNTGLLIWNTIKDGMRLSEVAKAFHSRFDDVDYETVLNDTLEYATMLYGKGFLKVVAHD
jgi:hypothetical protein